MSAASDLELFILSRGKFNRHAAIELFIPGELIKKDRSLAIRILAKVE